MANDHGRGDWQLLSWLVGVIAATGRVQGARPQSMLLVGPPGCGKTELLMRYKPHGNAAHINPHLAWGTSATSYGILHVLRDRVPRGVTHFVAPELQTLMRRKGVLWDAFIGIMLPAMEEGVWEILDGGKRWRFSGQRLGLMAACASDAYDKNIGELQASGLLSRTLVLHYSRAYEDVLWARQQKNRGDTRELDKVNQTLPATIDVSLGVKMADTIDRYAAAVNRDEVHRGGNRFQAFCKVIAWQERSRVVTQKHFDMLRRAEKFWRQG